MDRQTLQDGSSDNGSFDAAQDGPFDAAQDGPFEQGILALSAAQLLAVKALRNGCSLWHAAKAAGVSRLTLHQWRARHPEFSEAMERWEARELTLARSRVAELAPMASDAMSDALAKEDLRASLALLRSIQVLRGFGATKVQSEGK